MPAVRLDKCLIGSKVLPEEWPAKRKNKANIYVHKLPDEFLTKTK